MRRAEERLTASIITTSSIMLSSDMPFRLSGTACSYNNHFGWGARITPHIHVFRPFGASVALLRCSNSLPATAPCVALPPHIHVGRPPIFRTLRVLISSLPHTHPPPLPPPR